MLRYCIFGLLFAAALSSHASVRTVIVQPGQLIPTYSPGIGGDAFIDGRDWNATISDQKGSRHTVPVTLAKKYSWVSFRGAFKNALKLNPGRLLASAAVAGALAGVDWVFDEASQEVRRIDPLLYWDDYPFSGSYGYISSHCNTVWSKGANAAGLYKDATYLYLVMPANQAAMNAALSAGYSPLANCSNLYVNRKPIPAGFSPVSGQPVSVSDAELDAFVSGFSDPAFATDVAPDILASVPGSFDYPDSETFGGPNSIELPSVETTSLDQVSGDTVVKQETTTLDLVYSKNPLSVTVTPTTVTNTYQNGTLTNTTTNTVTGPTVDAQPLPEVPTDCEFMPTVCEWLAWFKEPIPMPEVDLPTPEDQDFEESYSASFGGGCPPPRQIALTLFPPVQFSWEPLCDFAGYLKFLVVGGAALMAAFIGLGISRGNA